MAPSSFRRLDKKVLLKMLSDLALSSKNNRTTADEPEKKGRVESVLLEECPSETQR